MWGQTNSITEIIKRLEALKAAAAAKGVSAEMVEAWYPQLCKDIAKFTARNAEDDKRQIARNDFWDAQQAKRFAQPREEAQELNPQRREEIQKFKAQRDKWSLKLAARQKKNNPKASVVVDKRREALIAEDKSIALKRAKKWENWRAENKKHDEIRAKKQEDRKTKRADNTNAENTNAKQKWDEALEARAERIQDENEQRTTNRQKFRDDLQAQYDQENLGTRTDHENYWAQLEKTRTKEDKDHAITVARLKRVNRTTFFDDFAHGLRKVFYRNGQSAFRHSQEFFKARGRNIARASTWVAYQARECFETIGRTLYRSAENACMHIGKGTEIVFRHIKQASRFIASEAKAFFQSIGTSMGRTFKEAGMFLAECASTCRRSVSRATTAPFYRLGDTIVTATIAVKRGFQDLNPAAAYRRSVEEELLMSDKDKEIIEGTDAEKLGHKFGLFRAPVDIDEASSYSEENTEEENLEADDEDLGIAPLLGR